MWIGSQRQWKLMEAGNSRAFNYEIIAYNSWSMFWNTTTNFINKEARSFSCFCCIFWQRMSNSVFLEVIFLFLFWNFDFNSHHSIKQIACIGVRKGIYFYVTSLLSFCFPNQISSVCFAVFNIQLSLLKTFPNESCSPKNLINSVKKMERFTIFHIFIE
jgi:hypothetical protein